MLQVEGGVELAQTKAIARFLAKQVRPFLLEDRYRKRMVCAQTLSVHFLAMLWIFRLSFSIRIDLFRCDMRHSLLSRNQLAQVAVEGYSTVYPCNAAAAFEVDEFIDAFEDVRLKLVPTFSIADAQEKEAARAALVAPGSGAVSQLLAKIEALCAQTQAGFMVGNTTTLADIWCFFFVNFLVCGFWDGLPASSVSAAQYPKLFAVVKRVASIPKVRVSLHSITTRLTSRHDPGSLLPLFQDPHTSHSLLLVVRSTFQVAAYYSTKDVSKEPTYKCFQC